MHEQRRLGLERLLSNLEQNTIELENLVIRLRNRTIVENDVTTLHELHEIELRLFALENIISDEVSRIKSLEGHTEMSTTKHIDATPSPSLVPEDPIVIQAKRTIEQIQKFLVENQFIELNGIKRSSIEADIEIIQNYLAAIKAGRLQEELLKYTLEQVKVQTAKLQTAFHQLNESTPTIPLSTQTTSTITTHNSPTSATNFICISEGFFHDSANVRIFHQCVRTETGLLKEYHFECPEGSHFDELLQHCSEQNELPATIAVSTLTQTTPSPSTTHFTPTNLKISDH